jgi:hypothetical protein
MDTVPVALLHTAIGTRPYPKNALMSFIVTSGPDGVFVCPNGCVCKTHHFQIDRQKGSNIFCNQAFKPPAINPFTKVYQFFVLKPL